MAITAERLGTQIYSRTAIDLRICVDYTLMITISQNNLPIYRRLHLPSQSSSIGPQIPRCSRFDWRSSHPNHIWSSGSPFAGWTRANFDLDLIGRNTTALASRMAQDASLSTSSPGWNCNHPYPTATSPVFFS
jgi:hypothetical protein